MEINPLASLTIPKEKKKKKIKPVTVTVCHYCRKQVDEETKDRTLKVERHHETGKKVLNKDGDKLYYHHPCKVKRLSTLIQEELGASSKSSTQKLK